MNTLHFKYALEVEKTGSITQAADNLYMGQPSLSKAIKELEDTLQIEIFKRSPRGMVPTKEGAQFLQYARNILVQIDNMEQIAKEKDGALKSLRITLPPSTYLFQAAFSFGPAIFKKQALQLEVLETNNRTALQYLLEGKCNFSVLRIAQDSFAYYQDYCGGRNLKTETIWTFHEQAVVSENASFTTNEALSPEDLEPFIQVRYPESQLPGHNPDFPDIPGRSTPVKHDSEHSICLSSQAQALDFLAENPDAYLKGEPLSAEILEARQLMTLPLKDAVQYQDILLYPENYRFSKTEHLFIDEIYRQKNRIAL